MNANSDNINFILFVILIGFSLINLLVDAILLYLFPKKTYKLLCAFWLSLCCVYLLQGAVPNKPLPVALAYSVSMAPILIFARILFDSLAIPFSLRKNILAWALCFPATVALAAVDVPFTALAMPFALVTAAPMLQAAYAVFIRLRHKQMPLQRLMGIYCLASSAHCINFALFRMVEGTQVWGWLISYGLYQLPGIILPALALDDLSKREKADLQKMVELRTDQLGFATTGLQQSLQGTQLLLRNVVHDIANPLFVLQSYAGYFKTCNHADNEEAIAKIVSSAAMVQDILQHIREMDLLRSNDGKPALAPVDFSLCLQDVFFLFQERFREKQLTAVVHNELPPEFKLLAERRSLIYSVLNNLISNSLKFSEPHSAITVSARLNGLREAVIEIADSGIGIPEEIMKNIFDMNRSESRPGTKGEKGHGFGMPLVKLYIQSYGGTISIESRERENFPDSHGTRVTLTLKAAWEAGAAT